MRTLLDAPCGDAHWIRAVTWHEPIRYLGGDICSALIARNRATNARDGWSFLPLDIRHDPVGADWQSAPRLVALSRCASCFSFRSRRDRATRHDIPYLLTSCHTACRINSDIPTGGFRLLNLQLPPYGLPEPLATIDDWFPGHAARQLALWSREQVAAVVRA